MLVFLLLLRLPPAVRRMARPRRSSREAGQRLCFFRGARLLAMG
jgi:hypothetical protein